MSNPYANQIRLAQVIDDSIKGEYRFFVCRTIEGKVQRFLIRMVQVDLETGDINVEYGTAEENHFEKASKMDLVLISQQSRQYDEKHRFEKREENERKARADFDALGKEMVKATTRAELVELGRKRADLAAYTGVSYVYENHCWNCKKQISSAIDAQCSDCRFYICSSCGSCFCGVSFC